MRTPSAICLTICLGLGMAGALPRLAVGQEPTATSAPKLAVPPQGVLTRAPAQPVPAAQVPNQPAAAAPAPAEPAPVTALTPSGGVTQLPTDTTGSTASGSSAGTASSSQAATAEKRSYVAGKFGLTIGGVNAGALRSVEGGVAVADVVTEKVGPDQVAKKHLGGVKYESISVTTGFDSKPLNEWISATTMGSSQRKNGSILEADYNNTVRGEREFNNAEITGVTFPALDASSKDAGFMTVQITPEFTRLKAGSGTLLTTVGKQQKNWTPANFRFEMDGLDGTKVNRIESFTIGQQVIEHSVGEVRDYEKAPGHLEFPNLKITLSSSAAQTWDAWHDDFVVKGNAGEDKERNGAIVFLDQSRTSELGRVNLYNCGIFRLAAVKAAAGSEAIQRTVAELYCERMEYLTKSK